MTTSRWWQLALLVAVIAALSMAGARAGVAGDDVTVVGGHRGGGGGFWCGCGDQIWSGAEWGSFTATTVDGFVAAGSSWTIVVSHGGRTTTYTSAQKRVRHGGSHTAWG